MKHESTVCFDFKALQLCTMNSCQNCLGVDEVIGRAGTQDIFSTKVHSSKPFKVSENEARSLRGEGDDGLADAGLRLGGLESLLEVLERVTGVEDRL